MAAVFDIELHDVDFVQKEDSDNDVVDLAEVVNNIIINNIKILIINLFYSG